MKLASISRFLRNLSKKLVEDAKEEDQGGAGFIKNPVTNNIKPRPIEEIYPTEDTQTESSPKPHSFKRPNDELVEHEVERTDKPHFKPERGKPAPQKWDYKDTMKDYMKDYRQQNRDMETGNKYIKKNINPKTDKRFKHN